MDAYVTLSGVLFVSCEDGAAGEANLSQLVQIQRRCIRNIIAAQERKVVMIRVAVDKGSRCIGSRLQDSIVVSIVVSIFPLCHWNRLGRVVKGDVLARLLVVTVPNDGQLSLIQNLVYSLVKQSHKSRHYCPM